MAKKSPARAPKFADKGFIVLNQIPVQGGAIQRDAYLFGYATQQKCETKIRRMYLDDPDAKVTISPLSADDIKHHKLKPEEIRLWQ